MTTTDTEITLLNLELAEEYDFLILALNVTGDSAVRNVVTEVSWW